MSKNDADEAVSVVSFISSSGGYVNGRNSANLGLLMNKTSLIYLLCQIKGYSFMNLLLFYKILKQCPSNYDIDEELQHTDQLFLGVACFIFLNFV